MRKKCKNLALPYKLLGFSTGSFFEDVFFLVLNIRRSDTRYSIFLCGNVCRHALEYPGTTLFRNKNNNNKTFLFLRMKTPLPVADRI